MKRVFITFLTVILIFCTCSCGVTKGQKLYTEEEFLEADGQNTGIADQ